LIICVGASIGDLLVPPTGLIPWFLKTEGNTYSTLLHHPFLFKGKPKQAQEVARRISGAIVGEVQVNTIAIRSSLVNVPISGTVAGEVYIKPTKYPS
jgi:hypothetical protein